MSDVRRKIVVGLDASNEARRALAWACESAGADDEILAVNAWEPPGVGGYSPAPPPATSFESFEHLADAELHRMVAEADDARVCGMLRRGRPGREIVAEGSDADMIVVGHRGEGRMSLMLGSTANYVLHHAAQPVIVLHGDPIAPPRRVVVGVEDQRRDDRNENASIRALKWAYELPGLEEVRVMHAWSIQPFIWDFVANVPQYLNELDEGAAAVIDRVLDAAGDPPDGVKVIDEVVRDATSHALIDASMDSDLVVVGSHGRGSWTGLLLGSTSQAVAAHAQAPVAVIR
jgi:nucleotide-binding universal stress UspA family protein